MKYYNKLLCLGLLIFAVSCGNEYDLEENFDLEVLPGYVAFFADGNSVNVAAVDLGENSGTAEVVVHSPVEILSDVTVSYTIGGTAVLGEDYSIEGTEGVMTISSDRNNFAETYRGSISLVGIDDAVFEGDKTITFTLTAASNAEGEIAVGRGGKDFQKEAVINLIDDECESEYAGAYDAYTIINSVTVDGMLVDTMIVTDTTLVNVAKLPGEYFSYNIDDASSGVYSLLGGTALSYDVVEDCGVVTADAQVDEFGRTINLVSGSIDENGVISITLESEEGGDQWVTVLTPM